MKAKIGPTADYEASDLTFFAEWRNERMRRKPKECCGDLGCWAIEGPPAISTGVAACGVPPCHCIKCGGLPTAGVRAAVLAEISDGGSAGGRQP